MRAARTPNKYQQHTYAFGGSTRIPATVMSSGEDNSLQLDDVSNQYIGKRSANNLLGRSSSAARPMTGNSRQSAASKLSKGTKAYYPSDYYERVGYQKSEATESVVTGRSRTDALGQRVRQRFNEAVDYPDQSAKGERKLDGQALSQVGSRARGPNSIAGSIRSRQSKHLSVAESLRSRRSQRPNSQLGIA